MNALTQFARRFRPCAALLAWLFLLSPVWAASYSSFIFGSSGGEHVFTIAYNGRYQGPSHQENWLRTGVNITYRNGAASLKYTVLCEENTGSARSGYIEFNLDGSPYKIYIAQDGIDGTPGKLNLPPATYKVVFNANGGKGKMAVQSFTYGKPKKLSANKFKRSGYTFKGWAKSKALAKKGKVAYKNKKTVKNLRKDGKTVKLYAVWKKK